MVVLNKIYTRTGDDGSTALSTGERLPKSHIRIESYGTVDETNATIGVARQYLRSPEFAILDKMLVRIQNDLFDLGADLCTPDRGEELGYEPLRIIPSQVDRLEREIDELNAELAPLRSFVLPAGHPAAAALHVCRTVSRRAERLMVRLRNLDDEPVGEPAMRYMNRLSDFFFVASRWVNAKGEGDVLWTPGANR
ncbi:cob(I)alamin adenosyltransferase [Rhodoligotrophos appendicifer]|uniref:cob(I)yrinic acid a,c-diamide adenosyltransferase n=1 Tax=Rhodoligotrophos appendicifer TaxID=987056 RepID=UPI001184C4E4|nr:cob(I)yrinic acid a,c-diamide adenosyltransferase [Rhodoligotrophos appendicifer]